MQELTSSLDNQTSEGYFEALWPRSPRQVKKKSLARRLDSLVGKRIAFLWDYMFRGDEVFTLLEEGLKNRYPNVEFINWAVFGNTHSKEEREVLASLPERLKELGISGVISGMAC